MEIITSQTNAKIKLAINLKQKKYRDKHKLFLLEGIRNAEMALKVNSDIKMCFCTKKVLENPRAKNIIDILNCPVYELTDNLYQKISDTDTPQGLMLLIKPKVLSLNEITVLDKDFYLVLDRLQDPGNIGTIIRTSDAMGVKGLICLNNTADIYSPKVVRSAMGSLFNIPIFTKVSDDELIAFVKKNDFKLLVTALDKDAKASWDIDYQTKCMVVLGNEGNGVCDKLLNNCTEKIYIPMQGEAESLNVANACAMIVYERCRQNI